MNKKNALWPGLTVAPTILLIVALAGCTPDPDSEFEGDDSSLPVPELVENLLSTHIRESDPLTPQQQQRTFHLPEGFEVQLFAAEPDIGKPMNMAFDARGRLWVTQSQEYPFAAKEGQGSDRITILEDTDGDGRADKFTVFADGLNVPIGVLPVEGGAIVYSVPYIYRFFDLDGDDRADQKIVLYGKFGYRDLHGMVNGLTRGFDGWIYACHGFTNTSNTRGADGHTITMESGNTFRFQLDGSRVEQNTYGQVNPFGLTFDPLGNMYSVDCHSQPVYQLQSGGDYPHFGKLPTGIGYGPEMIAHRHGSTAIAGIVYYAADQFPEEFHNNVLTGDVITNRLYRDRITSVGSTPVAEHESDFFISDDPWFRPVDLKLGPDGSIYVADFYNRIIGHYEVPLKHPGRDRERGRIWRIVYKDQVRKASRNVSRSDWAEASVSQLIADLGHPNLTVRTLATNQLADRWQKSAVGSLKKMLENPESNRFQRIHGLWALNRLGVSDSGLLSAAAADQDPGVRVHAMRILAQYSGDFGESERSLVHQGLKDTDPLVQRQAADALRVFPAGESVQPLLELAARIDHSDSHLLYVAAMALRDQLREPEILESALAQTWSEEEADHLEEVIVGVKSAPAAGFLLDRIRDREAGEEISLAQIEHIGRYLSEGEFDELVAWGKARSWGGLEEERLAFLSILKGVQGRGDEAARLARPWGLDLARRMMASRQGETRGLGFLLAGSLQWKRVAPELVRVLGSERESVDLRVAAARALVDIDESRYASLLVGAVRAAGNQPVLRNRMFGVVLAVQGLSGEGTEIKQQLVELMPILPSINQEYAAARLSRTREGTEMLLAAAEAKKFSPKALLNSSVGIHLPTHSEELTARYDRLTADLQPEDERRREMINRLRRSIDLATASPQNGWSLFQEHCVRCHQMAGQGKTIGPQLDGISERGVARFLEDVVDPSRNVAEGFKNQVLRLTNGAIRMGFPAEENDESILLLDDLENEIRILKSDIESMREIEESPMPSDFFDQLSVDQVSDLMSFLMSPEEGMR